jgi:hypothetical protein
MRQHAWKVAALAVLLGLAVPLMSAGAATHHPYPLGHARHCRAHYVSVVRHHRVRSELVAYRECVYRAPIVRGLVPTTTTPPVTTLPPALTTITTLPVTAPAPTTTTPPVTTTPAPPVTTTTAVDATLTASGSYYEFAVGIGVAGNGETLAPSVGEVTFTLYDGTTPIGSFTGAVGSPEDCSMDYSYILVDDLGGFYSSLYTPETSCSGGVSGVAASMPPADVFADDLYVVASFSGSPGWAPSVSAPFEVIPS